jgi:pilus assembly protein CpaF
MARRSTRRTPFGLVIEAVRDRIAGLLDPQALENPDEAVLNALRPVVEREIVRFNKEAGAKKQRTLHGPLDLLVEQVLSELLGLGPLETLLTHEAVEDIYILGPSKVLVALADGQRLAVDLEFGDQDRLMSLARKALAQDGKRVDFAQPFADARLRDGSRMHVGIHPCAEPWPQVVIRRHRQIFQPGDDRLARLIELGTLTPQVALLLRAAIRGRIPLLTAGATAAGKTTLINALGGEMDRLDAVVCIEDVRELDFPGVNVGYLMTRLPSSEGQGAINQRYLVQQSLRKRADWIVLGEARGEEAWDFAQAGNTGHAILGSVHANSALDAVERYRDLCLQAAENLRETVALRVVSRAFRLVIYLQHDGEGAGRVVRHVAEVSEHVSDRGAPTLIDLFVHRDGELVATGETPSDLLCAQLARGGIEWESIVSGEGVPEEWVAT